MERLKIKSLLENSAGIQLGSEITVKGWVRAFRSNRFIALNDGSTIKNIQCVIDFETTPEETLKRITTGAAIAVKGDVIESQGKGQSVEIQVSEIEILGDSEIEELKKKYNILNITQLPEISRFDPQALIMCMKPGQVCKFKRASSTALFYDYYRICV